MSCARTESSARGAAIRPAVCSTIGSAVCAAILDTWGPSGATVSWAFGAAVCSAIGSTVSPAIGPAISSTIAAATADSEASAVSAAVGATIADTRDPVGSAVSRTLEAYALVGILR